jgi:uncharacterized GH25 family protein
MMAVFTIGADAIRISKMRDIAEAWGFAGKYEEPVRLLQDAKKKRFDMILVVDPEAIDEKIKKELAALNVEIISFNDKKKLEKLVKI